MIDNIFSGISENISAEVFTSLIKNKNIHIERIVSYGQVTEAGDWYDQQENEWVMVLKGEAKLEFEGGRVEHLKMGDYIDIPAHIRHRVNWTAEDIETVWLAIHY